MRVRVRVHVRVCVHVSVHYWIWSEGGERIVNFFPCIVLPAASAVRQLPSSVNQIFNVATHSPKQLQQFKYSCVSLLATLLSHRRLAEQVHSENVATYKYMYIVRMTNKCICVYTLYMYMYTHGSQ